jgi:two-component system chemotaxis sensor kinase CheA
LVLVLQADEGKFALEVDAVMDSADIVVKPLHSRLKSIPAYSGATLMGDGAIALILDVSGIARLASMSTRREGGRTGQAHEVESAERQRRRDAQEYLVFRVGDHANLAVPLALVARLEEVRREQIDLSGGQPVLRYREQLLPVLPFAHFLESTGTGEQWTFPERFYVIVAFHRGRLYGFAVDAIEDIIEAMNDPDSGVRPSAWVIGTLLAEKRVYSVLDILKILAHEVKRLNPSEAHSPADRPEASAGTPDRLQGRVLLVEDSAFFRRQVQRMLERLGMTVVSAADGREAWDILREGQETAFDLVLSDIEMPNMTGLELAQAIRKEPRFASLPLIALTTRTQPADVERGRAVGFNFYLEKLEERVLAEAIHRVRSATHPGTPGQEEKRV